MVLCSFMIRIHSTLGTKVNMFSVVTGIYQIPTANVILNGETREAASLKAVQGQDALYGYFPSKSYQ